MRTRGRIRWRFTLWMSAGLAMAARGPAPASAQEARGVRVAVLPAQYFRADAQTALRISEGMRRDFAARGWTVVPEQRVKAAWDAAGLDPGVHYADREVAEIGRRAGADLVVYPRLLALGPPPGSGRGAPAALSPEAVVRVRIVSVKRRQGIYFNQIGQGHERVPWLAFRRQTLPARVAQTAASRALAAFFHRAGQ